MAAQDKDMHRARVRAIGVLAWLAQPARLPMEQKRRFETECAATLASANGAAVATAIQHWFASPVYVDPRSDADRSRDTGELSKREPGHRGLR